MPLNCQGNCHILHVIEKDIYLNMGFSRAVLARASKVLFSKAALGCNRQSFQDIFVNQLVQKCISIMVNIETGRKDNSNCVALFE